ncbi:unnamed protein product [Amoebophrya sp. A25]|nr:unnamed protein product [Amoebophrya sp. A25]|eukprot:GSA25T00017003001.1
MMYYDYRFGPRGSRNPPLVLAEGAFVYGMTNRRSSRRRLARWTSQRGSSRPASLSKTAKLLLHLPRSASCRRRSRLFVDG